MLKICRMFIIIACCRFSDFIAIFAGDLLLKLELKFLLFRLLNGLKIHLFINFYIEFI